MAYTTINKSSDYFNTKLYTGGSGNTAHTGVGFQPDLVWIKERTRVRNHAWFDAIRGARYWIGSNSNGAQDYNSGAYLVSLDSDGFTTTDTDVVGKNGLTYASWNWKAGTTGSGTSTGSGTGKAYSYSVSTTAGFSIVKYIGNGTAGHTIPHHLGVAPKMIIVKSIAAVQSWIVLPPTITGYDKDMKLEDNTALGNSDVWNNTAPSSTVFSVGTNTNMNDNNATFISYSFAEKQGYSKFGTYIGNGNADGRFVYTGFKPAFIIVKRTDNSGDWQLMDNKRDSINVMDTNLFPNSADADTASNTYDTDFISNGFKFRGTSGARNGSGMSYIYMAFAEEPLVASNYNVATAR